MQSFKLKLSFSLTLLLALCFSFCRSSYADPPAPDMVINGAGPLTLYVGQTKEVALDAVVNNPPATNQECTITGPVWTWKATAGDKNLSASGNASGTVEVSFDTPGVYTVNVAAQAEYTSTCEAKPIDVPGTTSFQVRVVGVSKIQYQDGSDWKDVTGALYVLKGTKVNFKAIPNPDGTWPTGKPVWGGSASGTGETTSVTFDTTSFSSFSPSTVTAECGNTVSIDVVVYELNITTTPDDNFSGRSQTRYGVGELVAVGYSTSPPTAAFYLQSETLDLAVTGTGHLRNVVNGTGQFVTEAVAGATVLTLTIQSGVSKGGTVSVNRSVVAPDSSSYIRPHYVVAHDKDTCSVGFYGDIYLTPKDVSFAGIGFAEGNGLTTATGWLQPDFDNLAHTPTGGSLGAVYLSISTGNIDTGCRVEIGGGLGDTIAFASYPRISPPPYGEGTVTWPIDWWYLYVDPDTNQEFPEKFMVATEYGMSSDTGKATMTKAGSITVSAEAADPTTAPSGWPGFVYPAQR